MAPSLSPTHAPTGSPIENFNEEATLYAAGTVLLLLLFFTFCCAFGLHAKSVAITRHDEYQELREVERNLLKSFSINAIDLVTNKAILNDQPTQGKGITTQAKRPR